MDNARITLVGSWGTNEMMMGYGTVPNTLAAFPRYQHPLCVWMANWLRSSH